MADPATLGALAKAGGSALATGGKAAGGAALKGGQLAGRGIFKVGKGGLGFGKQAFVQQNPLLGVLQAKSPLEATQGPGQKQPSILEAILAQNQVEQQRNQAPGFSQETRQPQIGFDNQFDQFLAGRGAFG